MNAALIHAAINLLQDQQNPEEQYYTPVVAEIRPPIKPNPGTPANNNNNNAEDAPAANSTQRTPTVAAHAWHYTAMSAATFTLSALLGCIATEAIVKRIRGRN